MFNNKDFEHLESLWDGKVANSNEVCNTCGFCCHNVAKTLYPGEAEYALLKVGINNPEWKSMGCLCYSIEDKYKPIICKVFPLGLKVSLTGYEVDFNVGISAYSGNCQSLIYTEEVKEKAKNFLDFLFSDIDNRVFYMLAFNLHAEISSEKQIVKDQGKVLAGSEATLRGVYRTFGLPVKQYFQYWKL